MPETPKGPKRPAKNTRAAQEAAKAIGKAKVAAKATKAPTPAKKLGAPTTFNQRIADLICIMISEGMSLRKILKEDKTGMLPAQSTVYEWLLRYPDFAEQYARAREEQADTLADEIIDIADEQPEIVAVTDKRTGELIEHKLDGAFLQWQKNRIEARKWTAMKLKPKKYGDRVAMEGVEGGAPITTQDATADKFLEIIRNMEMKKRAG
jgi:DNA primase